MSSKATANPFSPILNVLVASEALQAPPIICSALQLNVEVVHYHHHHPSTRTLPRATTSWHQQSLWRCSWLEAARQRDSRALSDLSLPPQVPLQCSRRPLFAHTPLLLDLHLLGSDCQSLRDGMRVRSQRWIKRANTSS